MEKLMTRFGKELNRDLPLNEYPRPQLVRDSFQNLNGQWDYAIYPIASEFGGYQGKITVPFSPECILSGVEKTVTPTDKLYYKREFEFHKEKARAILHFGAVDYECSVKINNRLVGSHKGGYYPFDFDITEVIKEGVNEITVEVTDPSETGSQARGKQTSKRGGVWYTPQSGIWQTVWIEQVCDNYIESLKITPDIVAGNVEVVLKFSGKNESARVDVVDKGEIKASVNALDGKAVISMGEFNLWSPEDPYLYDLKIVAGEDEIGSYFGMRSFGIGDDENGVPRLLLNGKPYFHNGLLDQGYWSDGMYTAPSDEALIYDIKTMKDMGFNMLRKHIKIEPLRWYYHCDRLGMLVWQDMISGGGKYNPMCTMIRPGFSMFFMTKGLHKKDTEENYKYFARTDEEGRKEYYVDSERMINLLYNTVSISVWVPFNEGWGQFDAVKAYEFYRKLDPTRIIDHASGWHDQGIGDLNSFHIYFTTYSFPKYNASDRRPIVLSEFGGFGLQPKGHIFNTDKFFGYRKYYSEESYAAALEKLYKKKIVGNIPKGLSAAVYTEVSDVEDECNGLLSYDREVVKIPVERMAKINSEVKI